MLWGTGNAIVVEPENVSQEIAHSTSPRTSLRRMEFITALPASHARSGAQGEPQGEPQGERSSLQLLFTLFSLGIGSWTGVSRPSRKVIFTFQVGWCSCHGHPEQRHSSCLSKNCFQETTREAVLLSKLKPSEISTLSTPTLFAYWMLNRGLSLYSRGMGSCFAKCQHSEFFLCGFVGHLSLCAMEKKVIFL